MVNTTQDVLFETPKNGYQGGYTKNYTPVRVKSEKDLTGEITRVYITGVKDGALSGIPVEK